MSDSFKEAIEKLKRPFRIEQVKWRKSNGEPQNGYVEMIPYIDARDVMERLDEVFGMDQWSCEFTPWLASADVVCTISAIFYGDGVDEEYTIKKSDVGSPNSGNPEYQRKTAFSDSLKRAAVHLGVGRYLYSLSGCWVACDGNGYPRHNPTLPDWAMVEEDVKKVAEAAAKAKEEADAAAKAKPPVAPANGVPNGTVPPTQRLGGDGRQQQAKPFVFDGSTIVAEERHQREVTLPQLTLTVGYQEAWKKLAPDDQAIATKIGDAIGMASGPKGSRVTLRRYCDAYLSRELPYGVIEFLNAFITEAWLNTPPEFVGAPGGVQ